MKRLNIVFVFVTIIAAISCSKKEIPDLVAAYYFSGNARDASGNENHALIYGAKLTRDRFGNEKGAYLFNGTSDYIEALVTGMPAVESPQTISLWYKIDQAPDYIDSLGADNLIALVDSAKGVGLQVGYRAAGYHTLGLDVWYWGGRTVLESEQPVTMKWHHALYSYDGKLHSFYLDGQLVNQSSVEPQEGKPKILMFGNYPAGDQFFAGSLDEILIYNRALKSSEVKLLYNKKE